MKTNFVIAVVTTCLCGCAATPDDPSVWMPGSGATLLLPQVDAKCDYETSAATQGTDYAYRTSLGRELDRALRKQDLYGKCMRANGFYQEKSSTVLNRPTDPKWTALEDDLEMAKKLRANARARLTANPVSPDSSTWSDEIKALNIEVADLEKKLSYAPTPSVSPNP